MPAVGYRAVFGAVEYRYLFIAYALSQFGDRLSAVAVSFLVYAATGSATLAGVAFASTGLSWLVGGPLLSRYADRYPRRQVLVWCDAARAGLIGALALPGVPIWALLALLLTAALLRSPYQAARAALIPEVLVGDRYPVGNGLEHLVREGGAVLGLAAAGALVAAVSPHSALLVDAATFAVSAVLIAAGVRHRPVLTAAEPATGFRGTARWLFGEPRLRSYLLLFWLANAAILAAEGLVAPLAARYGGGPGTGGLLLACAPAGTVAGGIALTRLCGPHIRRRLIVPAALLGCVALLPVGLRPPLWTVAACLAVAGLGGAFAIALNPMFGQALPAHRRGQAFGVAITGGLGIQGLAAAAAGAAADHWPPTTVVAAAGIAGTAAVLVLARHWPDRAPTGPAHPRPIRAPTA